jgi:hypothetical protein
MQLDPARVSYLQLAKNRLGPIDDWHIDQRGEPWRPHSQRFAILDQPHLRPLRHRGVLVT